MDRYTRSLPADARRLVCQGNPQSGDQLVELIEGYQAAQSAGRSDEPRRPTARPRTGAMRTDRTQGRPDAGQEVRRCFHCGEEGHTAWGCPHRRDASMPSASEVSGRPCGLVEPVDQGRSSTPPMTPVRANGQDTTAMLDSGSAVTLIRPEYAQEPYLQPSMGVTCIHGDTREYPTTTLNLQTIKGQSTGAV